MLTPGTFYLAFDTSIYPVPGTLFSTYLGDWRVAADREWHAFRSSQPLGIGREVFMCQAYCAAILPGRINVTRHVIPAPESGFAGKGAESRIPPRPYKTVRATIVESNS